MRSAEGGWLLKKTDSEFFRLAVRLAVALCALALFRRRVLVLEPLEQCRKTEWADARGLEHRDAAFVGAHFQTPRIGQRRERRGRVDEPLARGRAAAEKKRAAERKARAFHHADHRVMLHHMAELVTEHARKLVGAFHQRDELMGQHQDAARQREGIFELHLGDNDRDVEGRARRSEDALGQAVKDGERGLVLLARAGAEALRRTPHASARRSAARPRPAPGAPAPRRDKAARNKRRPRAAALAAPKRRARRISKRALRLGNRCGARLRNSATAASSSITSRASPALREPMRKPACSPGVRSKSVR